MTNMDPELLALYPDGKVPMNPYADPDREVGVKTDQTHLWATDDFSQFLQGRPYTKFEVFAVLNHEGDVQAASDALRQRGYGE